MINVITTLEMMAAAVGRSARCEALRSTSAGGNPISGIAGRSARASAGYATVALPISITRFGSPEVRSKM
jgi:hypothetical protein